VGVSLLVLTQGIGTIRVDGFQPFIGGSLVMPSAMLLVFIGECIRRQFGAHGTVKMKSTQEHIGFPWIIGGIQHGGKYFLVSVEFVPQSVRICNLKELRERNAAKVYPGCEIISMHMDYQSRDRASRARGALSDTLHHQPRC